MKPILPSRPNHSWLRRRLRDAIQDLLRRARVMMMRRDGQALRSVSAGTLRRGVGLRRYTDSDAGGNMKILTIRRLSTIALVLFACAARAGDPARIIAISSPSSIAAGSTTSTPFVVEVVDSLGTRVAGASLLFQAYPATFEGQNGVVVKTDDNGRAASPPLSVPMASHTEK